MINADYMAEFTFQREWVERRGFLLVLAFYLGGLGAGLYLVSMYFGYLPGMVTGFLIVALLKTSTHIAYLGKPLRFWRAFLRPQSSWISRGIVIVVGFVIFAGLQLGGRAVSGGTPGFGLLPWSAGYLPLVVMTVVSGIALMAYTGFALAVVNAIGAWNTALMPLLFIAYSALGGVGLTLGLGAIGGMTHETLIDVERLARWGIVIVAVIIAIYLWLTYYTTPSGKKSVQELLKGAISPYLWFGVVVVGLAVPFTIGISALFYSIPNYLIIISSACELTGGFMVRYSILKAGIYAPLI